MKMKRTISTLLIMLLMHTALPAESYFKMELDNPRNDNADRDNGTQQSQISKEYEDDLVMGYFMAIGPGIIIHGAGNMYADKWTRGLILFSAGLLGTVGIFWCEFTVSRENYWEPDEDDNTWLLVGSLILFFGSYAWDIATVGGAIRERHPEGAHINFGILPGNDKNQHAMFGIRISF